MLSKEEAVLLPAVLIGWNVLSFRRLPMSGTRRKVFGLIAAGTALEAAYFAMRIRSHAFTASSAPASSAPA
jgi:hypothetical protein